jgi:hypothetical protein
MMVRSFRATVVLRPVVDPLCGTLSESSHPRWRHPEMIQQDGRIRRWTQIDEMDGRYLRVILLPDQETVHNAFFDRTFRP